MPHTLNKPILFPFQHLKLTGIADAECTYPCLWMPSQLTMLISVPSAPQRAQAEVYRRLLHATQRVERSEVVGAREGQGRARKAAYAIGGLGWAAGRSGVPLCGS